MNGPIEQRIAELIADTRRRNERYVSAHYRGPNQTSGTGLGNRLEAIEQALLILAREVDATSKPLPSDRRRDPA